MDKKEILENLFDKKMISVLRLFINNQNDEFYLREVSKAAKVPVATTHRIIQKLLQLKLLIEYKTKHLKTYSLNSKNASFLTDILEDKRTALQEFKEFISGVPNVDMAVLHGAEEKDKASVLIIGDGVDQELIRSRLIEIKQAYGFNIIHLILGPDQYTQMVSMGLYPGRKVTLYKAPSTTKEWS